MARHWKIINLIVVLIIATLLLASCNKNIGVGTYNFTHAHIFDGTVGYCVKVNSWHDDDMGCEIHTPNGAAFLSEGTYQLFESAKTCPYCD